MRGSPSAMFRKKWSRARSNSLRIGCARGIAAAVSVQKKLCRIVLGLAVLLVLALLPHLTFAQVKYPTHPIRLVVPFPPGGSYDAIGRPWADKMKALLGPVVVENQGGAGSSLGAAAVARARPDGYTLLIGGGNTHVTEALLKKRPLYDPLADLAPISLLALTPFAIAVHPSLPVNSLPELISYAQATPGNLSYGSAGVGSLNHLTGELFKSLTGLRDIVHVPYRGAGPAIADLIAGQVPIIVAAMSGQVLALHHSSKLRVLAVTSPTRLKGLPETPTAREIGLSDLIAENSIGLLAPAGTPREIIERIAEATRTAMADPNYQQMFIASAFEPQMDSNPDKFRRFLEQEIAHWRPLVHAIGLKLD
jgi:tripartite-type tricarboxylate transporter receptor subunit TctC